MNVENRFRNKVTILPEKIFHREKKSIALYSSTHTLLACLHD